MMTSKGKEKAPRVAKRKPGRQPSACTECRRLKLKCDGRVPCSTCVKRGCNAICPDGALAAGKGTRLVLTNTQELHDRLEKLCFRLRELELALQELQAKVSDEPHPLLLPEAKKDLPPCSLASIPPKSQASSHRPEPAGDSETSKSEDLIDAFGTLTVGPKGEVAFLGPTARSEYLINACAQALPADQHSYPNLSPKLVDAGKLASGHAIQCPAIRKEVFAMLPPMSEAVRLLELYERHGEYLWCGLPHDDLYNDILSEVYRARCVEDLPSPHHLSFIFIAFAMATLHDVDRPPYCPEAEEYYLLAQVSFRFAHLDRELNLKTVVTMCHIGQYLEMSDWQLAGSSKSWINAGTAMRFALMMGLHLNSDRFDFEAHCVEKRSRVFWQVFLLDTWHSFFLGRPPTLPASYIDCKFPKCMSITTKEGREEISYHGWMWQFTRLLHNVMANTLCSAVPPYTAIIEWDRKIREFPVPLHLRPICNDTEASDTLTTQRFFVLACKEMVLLNLHRRYFTQALKLQPAEVLKHMYGPSVMATYRSAWRVIEGLRVPATQAPHMLRRVSLAWSQALSAAIVLCLIVTQTPTSCLVPSSLEELDMVASLFEDASPLCPAAAHSLSTIQDLRSKAREAANNKTDVLSPSELERLGGNTKSNVMYRQALNGLTAPLNSNNSMTGVGSVTLNPSDLDRAEGLHPTLLQDMRVFDGVDNANFNAIFDFPPDTFPQREAVPSAQATTDGVFGGEVFGAPSWQEQGEGSHPFQVDPTISSNGYTAMGSSAFDPAWQDFMEQLGM